MSKMINAGIASFGMSGRVFHAPFLQAHPGFCLKAIVERHRNESRGRYPQSALYRSFEQLLNDADIGLVIVNTPVQTHFELAGAALAAGKNIVVEKPFTVTAAEAQELEKTAREKGLFLSVYQNRRFDGDYLAVRNVVKENMLGEIKEAEIHFDRFRPRPGGKEHKESNLPGAGNLHDLGAHLIDQALQLFGFPEAVFADVFAMRQGTGASDYFEVLLYYPGTLRVRLKGTVFCRAPNYAYIMQGTRGSFMQMRSDLQEEKLQQGAVPGLAAWTDTPDGFNGLLHTEINGREIKKETRAESGNYMNYYEQVYNALANDGNNPVPAADAVLTMKIIDAALQSSREERIVRVQA